MTRPYPCSFNVIKIPAEFWTSIESQFYSTTRLDSVALSNEEKQQQKMTLKTLRSMYTKFTQDMCVDLHTDSGSNENI